MTRVMGVMADLFYRAYHDTGIDARICRVFGCKPCDCGWPWVRCTRCHTVRTEMR